MISWRELLELVYFGNQIKGKEDLVNNEFEKLLNTTIYVDDFNRVDDSMKNETTNVKTYVARNRFVCIITNGKHLFKDKHPLRLRSKRKGKCDR